MRAGFGRPAIDLAQFCTAGQARYGTANGLETAPGLSLPASLLGRTRPTLRLTRCASRLSPRCGWLRYYKLPNQRNRCRRLG